MKRILCICLSSTLQRTVNFENITLTEVNRSKNYRQDASGKAVNSARVLNQLEKGCVKIVCPVGEKNQQLFEELAAKDELNIKTVAIPGFTRECWTLLDRNAGTTTELVVGEPLPGPEYTEEIRKAEIKLLKYINESFDEVEGVLLAGSRPGIWSEDLYGAIAGMSKDAGKVFLADYIGKDLEETLKTVTPDIIKINDEEFCKTFGVKPEELKDSIISKSKELGNIIVVTRGIDSTYGARNGEFAECPTEKVDAVNTTACGDSFNAGFLHEYLNTSDFNSALKKGTWCAARNAERETPGAII